MNMNITDINNILESKLPATASEATTLRLRFVPDQTKLAANCWLTLAWRCRTPQKSFKMCGENRLNPLPSRLNARSFHDNCGTWASSLQ
jgi:hypothetical protein